MVKQTQSASIRPQLGDAFTEYMRDVGELSSNGAVPKQEEELRANEYLASLGDSEGRIKLILANLKLVAHVAMKHAATGRYVGLDPLDLVQEGNIGLMQAAITYKYGTGAKFSTWAVYRIEGSIKDAIRRQHTEKGRPRSALRLYPKIVDASLFLMESLGRNPSSREIAKHLSLPVEEVEQITHLMTVLTQAPLPLDAYWRDGKTSSLEDTIEDLNADDPELTAIRRDKQKNLRSVINEVLSPRERLIVAFYFNLTDDRRVWSYKEVGKALGISESRTCQLSKRALDKLRTHPQLAQWYDRLPGAQRNPGVNARRLQLEAVKADRRELIRDWNSRLIPITDPTA